MLWVSLLAIISSWAVSAFSYLTGTSSFWIKLLGTIIHTSMASCPSFSSFLLLITIGIELLLQHFFKCTHPTIIINNVGHWIHGSIQPWRIWLCQIGTTSFYDSRSSSSTFTPELKKWTQSGSEDIQWRATAATGFSLLFSEFIKFFWK